MKLCHALPGTLPFTLIGLATNRDRPHCRQTPSEALETAEMASSHLDPIYSEALSMGTNNMYIASRVLGHTNDTHGPFPPVNLADDALYTLFGTKTDHLYSTQSHSKRTRT